MQDRRRALTADEDVHSLSGKMSKLWFSFFSSAAVALGEFETPWLRIN